MNQTQAANKLEYNRITVKTVVGERIRYGILNGNERIVFIKPGADGTIRGYRDKYLKIAHRIHRRLGATVICASNPDADYSAQGIADKAMISDVAAKLRFVDYEVYLFGTSDGVHQNIRLAQSIPQTVKILGVNPSFMDVADFVKILGEIPHVKKQLVFGTEDEDFAYVSELQSLECKNLEVLTVEGADHQFTGMLDAYIALVDLL